MAGAITQDCLYVDEQTPLNKCQHALEQIPIGCRQTGVSACVLGRTTPYHAVPGSPPTETP